MESSFSLPYPVMFSSLLCEEDVIHETRRKRQRIGKSPPYPRQQLPPPEPHQSRGIQCNRCGTRAQSPSSSRQLPQIQKSESRNRSSGMPAPIPGISSRDAVRASLQEAINEVYSGTKKIKKLLRIMEMDNEYQRVKPNFVLIKDKVEELYDVLSSQLSDAGGTNREGIRPRFDPQRRATIVTTAPSKEDMLVFTSNNHQDKRKRSRQIISLQKTSEKMEIDVDF